MSSYTTYKSSGIEWLGDIPHHWEVKRLKLIGENIGGLTYSPDDVLEDESGTLVLRSSNIQNGKFSKKDNVFVDLEIPEKKKTYEGDILCEKINNIFEGKRFGSINCWDGKYIPFGINAQDLYQFNGSISYTFDETK
jgi:restriction endonuclease S subunit